MATAYLGIGSNLGERTVNIKEAIKLLGETKGIKVIKASSLIETEPVGGPAQGKYLNGALEIKTDLQPDNLLKALQDIEAKLGRARTVKDGPRTIDIDILLYDKRVVNEKDLIIPHPRMGQRDFVKIPLREIAPEVII